MLGRAGDSGYRLHYRYNEMPSSNGSFRWQESDSASVSDGINKADELVELAMSGNVPVYHRKCISLITESE